MTKDYQALREKVFERDYHRCVICGCTDSDRIRPLQIRYKIPKALGGKEVMDNMLTVCTKHQDRGTRYRRMALEQIQLLQQEFSSKK